MAISKHFLYAILQLWGLFLTAVVQAQNQEGFISIDCGTSKSRYTDEQTGITYLSDENFVESGENRDILSAYKEQTEEQQFWNVRSFPEGTRNCYLLEPSGDEGIRYLIRARFMYGNYDNKGNPPMFDLYIGVDLWKSVIIENSREIVDTEILHVPSSDQIHVCLVNTDFGTPFISALELRPLKKNAYVSETASLLLEGRWDFGSAPNQVMRYKDDPYDRLWSPYEADVWTPLKASSEENNITRDVLEVPFTVMSTAYTKERNVTYMGLNLSKRNTSARYFFVMEFAELEKLNASQSREFNIYVNGFLWYGSVIPEYLKIFSLLSTGGTAPDSGGEFQIWFNSTGNSTLPPLVNAFEVYLYQDSSGQETYPADVRGILGIKADYGLKIANWQGDPCSPESYSWDRLNCTYNSNLPPRISSLNLSSNGLEGEISMSFANLTRLQYLDLSNNSLTGTLPEYLADLTYLTVLNLRGNKLEGPVPAKLLERSKDGLSLSVDENVMPNTETPSTPSDGSSSSPSLSSRDYKLFIAIFCGVFLNFVL